MSDNIDLDVQVVDERPSGDSQHLNSCMNSGHCHRVTQRVSSAHDRKTVVKWMQAEFEKAGIEMLASKAVRKFPAIFGRHDYKWTKAALTKAGRCRKSREYIANAPVTTIFRAGGAGRRRNYVKVSIGRGRKRAIWVSALYSDVLDKFHTLRRAGCKISTSILRLIVLEFLKESKEGVYGSGVLDPRSKMTMASLNSTSRVLHFQDNHGLHSRRQAGKLQLSREKTEEMECAVSKHLGQLKRKFYSGELDENFVENGDETHFSMNMDSGKILAAVNEN
jgi:hypothetical protein